MKIISFDQAFQDITKEVTKIPRKEYLSHGQFPIVDQGDGEIAGYTNCGKGLYTEVPVVLFGDHTRVFKYINFPFFAGADGTKILKAKSGTDAHFGYYSFMQYPLISLGYSRHFKLLKERMFHTFDYATQLRIAAILGSIDEKIELNRKKIAELEALAKTIYDYWFVQFDFPDKNGKPYKSSGGKMVWNEQLKREIPDEWEVKPLGEIAIFSNGINYTTENQKGKKYRIVNVRDISATNLFIHGRDLSEITLPSAFAEKYVIPANCILIARSGIPGAIRLIANPQDTLYCGFIIICRPTIADLRPYLAYFMKSLEGSGATHKDSSILNNVSQDMLKRIYIPIPDDVTLLSFKSLMDDLFENIISIQTGIEETTILRDTLLPLLMNGQVEVKE